MKKKFCWIRTVHEQLEIAMFQVMELQNQLLEKSKDLLPQSLTVTMILQQKPLQLQPTTAYYVVMLVTSYIGFFDAEGKELKNGAYVMGAAADITQKKYDA